MDFSLTTAHSASNSLEVKHLLEANLSDLKEIVMETKMFHDRIEDTIQFMCAHIDCIRNELMYCSLFSEVGSFIMGTGTFVSGIFGMNLTNHIELHEYAFIMVCMGIAFMMSCFIACFYRKYCQLHGNTDTSSAHSFNLLKNFFTYVDDLEYYVFNKKFLTAQEFKDAIEKILKLEISNNEAEYLFAMFDANMDGKIDIESELKINLNPENDH